MLVVEQLILQPLLEQVDLTLRRPVNVTSDMVAPVIQQLVISVLPETTRPSLEILIVLTVRSANFSTQILHMMAQRTSARLVDRGIALQAQVCLEPQLRPPACVIQDLREVIAQCRLLVNRVRLETSKRLQVMRIVEHAKTMSSRLMIAQAA